jgi:hypothetical protein
LAAAFDKGNRISQLGVSLIGIQKEYGHKKDSGFQRAGMTALQQYYKKLYYFIPPDMIKV